MSDPIEFYRQQLVAHARTLPMHEAVIFLRGALAVSGVRADMVDVQRAVSALIVADDQLELIAGAQGKLNLHGGNGQ